MGWQDRDYSKSRRREPDDEPYSPHADDDASWDDDEEAEDHEIDTGEDDPEAPDASDRDDGDEPATIRCPNCRRMIVEDAEQCPHCGAFVEERKLAGRPTWVWVGLLLAMLVAAMWAVFH